jgi:hypothetical protein
VTPAGRGPTTLAQEAPSTPRMPGVSCMTELFADIESEPRGRFGRDAPWLRRLLLVAFAVLIALVLVA